MRLENGQSKEGSEGERRLQRMNEWMNPVKHLSLWSSSLSFFEFFLSFFRQVLLSCLTVKRSFTTNGIAISPLRCIQKTFYSPSSLSSLFFSFLLTVSFLSLSFSPFFSFPPLLSHFCVSVFSHSSTPPLTFFLTIFSQIKDRSTEHKNHSLVSTESFFSPHFCEEKEDRRLTNGLGWYKKKKKR